MKINIFLLFLEYRRANDLIANMCEGAGIGINPPAAADADASAGPSREVTSERSNCQHVRRGGNGINIIVGINTPAAADAGPS